MTPPGAETVLIRYGDMSTKSRQVRTYMERLLVENVQALLDDRGIDAEVERRHARPLVHTTSEEVERVAAVAAEAFGVVSTSPVARIDPDHETIENALVETALANYEGGSFAIDARRAGTALPFTSDDVEEFGGAAVFEALDEAGHDPEVDLDDPDHTFSIECREDVAYLYVGRIDGPGGLPLGTQGKLVGLLSGGLDSPVAVYEAMRRGSPVVPLYLDLGPYGGPDHRARAEEVAAHLGDLAPNFDTRLRVVDAGEAATRLADEMDAGRMLSLRRFMLRVAELLAEYVEADGIVTGEAIGQKSSQTVRNLRVTDVAVDLPVHRPLLTVDKNEIAERAKAIGTFRDSTIPTGCQRFAPSRPETNGRLDRLLEVEPDGVFEMAERAVEDVDVVDP